MNASDEIFDHSVPCATFYAAAFWGPVIAARALCALISAAGRQLR